jgi:ketosteroid isomerase-like protein
MFHAAVSLALLLLMPAALLDHGPDDQTAIRRARENSNRAITRRNLLGVADSLAPDYVAVTGNGGFVASRDEYLRLFKADFDAGKKSLTYERTPDKIELRDDHTLAAEHGHWVGKTADGVLAYTGTYLAMWRKDPEGWKIRSELFVTLTGHS